VLCFPAGRGGEGAAKCCVGLFFFVLMLVQVHGGFMFLFSCLFWLRDEVTTCK
jgi:hypothetical protein